MPKKSSGLLTLALGAVAGAAAVFFANKDNRTKTKQLAKQTVKQAETKVKKHLKTAQKTVVKAKKTAETVKNAAQKAAAAAKKVHRS